MHSTTIPFSGFYSSLHDDALTDAVQQMFSDLGSGCTINDGLADRAISEVDWRRVHSVYAKEYCGDFADYFEIKLEFDELVSPREYNFTTDRIFAKMTTETLLDIRKRVDEKVLRQAIHDRHTSYDGFYSFYSNTLESWPEDVTEWDANQVGTLVWALVLTVEPEWDCWKEHSLTDDWSGNGLLDNWLCDDGKLDRLLKVHEYLDRVRPSRTVMA